jgi:SAM-dependent methyltransferase
MRDRVMAYAYAVHLRPQPPLWARLALLPIRNRLGGLPPRVARPGRILDAGCGDGYFLYQARRQGWDVLGLEVNPAAVASAQKAGLPVRLGDLSSTDLEAGAFDFVRLWHVLEHVPDPVLTLRQARRLLAPQGRLIVGVPDFASPLRRLFGPRWSGLQLPYHLHHFDSVTLRATLEAAGYRVHKQTHRSVGTFYSSLVGTGRGASAIVWPLGLLLDDLLDLAGKGDALEVLAGLSPDSG